MLSTTILAAALIPIAGSGPMHASTDVRVGIVAYEDFHREFDRFRQTFAEISKRDPALRFRLAAGTYGEVLHWLDWKMVDIAVLTPGVFATLLRADQGELGAGSIRCLAGVLLPPARSSWASAARRAGHASQDYRSVCLVPEGSSLHDISDVRRQARRNGVEFLFVHPLSLSGHVVPLEALRQAGIDISSAPIRFTYSHSQSIRMLADRSPDRSPDRERVAFVWDDAAGNDRDLEENVRKVPFPELDQLAIPHDVVVARGAFKEADRVQSLLLGGAGDDQHYRFVRPDNWQVRFGPVRDWMRGAGEVATVDEGERVSLDEIGRILLQYSQSQPRPPRVALVLSGGGARCSYQVGAVAAIEKKFARLRRDHPKHPLDIDLVVGTSGGAINSLPVALGVAKTEEGLRAFRRTWKELDQREIVRPPPLVRVNVGLWFAALQTILIIVLVRWRVPEGSRRSWTFAAVYTGLAGIEILLGYTAPFSWAWLGTNHVVHHTWLWLNFGMRTSAWSLFAIGIGTLVLQAARARRGDRIRLPKRFAITVLIAGIFGLPLLQLITMLAFEETLSDGQGMEDALARKTPRLINRYLAQEKNRPLKIDENASANVALRSISRQIVERRLLQRDLVITGSCLGQSGRNLPPDLYFYLSADGTVEASPYGDHGLSLRTHPEVLLDVILGSGSIYPVFPARKIHGLPRQGEWIELIDGGFAHNSPVEAAVLWGATHVILIDVTPHGKMKRGTFLQNLISSVRHLHRQAQLLDTRSRKKVTIFTLSPDQPHICIIDFASNLIARSIDLGYDDAMQDGTSAKPRFQRGIGEPVFVEITDAE